MSYIKEQENSLLSNIVIGIGAQKAATSWLFMCLDEHPDICTVPSKEVHFFSYLDRFEKGIGWYEKQFTHCVGNVPKVEISTSYLSDPMAISRIARFYPHTKVIVSFRNPVDRAISHMRHLQSKGLIEEDMSVQEIISQYPEVIENGMYGKHLAHIYNYFDRKSVHVILYDDIKEDEQHVVSQLYNFLNVKSDFIPKSLHFRVNSAELRFFPLYKRINKLYIQVIQYRLGRMLIGMLKKTGLRSHKLSRFLKREDDMRFRCEIDLFSCFENDIKKLEGLLGRDLSCWYKRA
ncbi:MAG: sulfotransferase domain-containing protein [Candidatus Pacebacteria bacterium]|nr:sulfotransferase domain-containing protein [Candidatus Paceibacterota bacterium]